MEFSNAHFSSKITKAKLLFSNISTGHSVIIVNRSLKDSTYISYFTAFVMLLIDYKFFFKSESCVIFLVIQVPKMNERFPSIHCHCFSNTFKHSVNCWSKLFIVLNCASVA